VVYETAPVVASDRDLPPSVEQLRSARAALEQASAPLRALSLEQRAAAIERAARSLLDPHAALGLQLRAELATSSGHSAQVIDHGLRTTLALFERGALLELAGARRGQSPPLLIAVLAGNVFSAAARPLLLPLLCGTAVLAKAASADDSFPRWLWRALVEADARVGAACTVATFAHERTELEAALLERAELVSVYGSDETLAALRARLPATARLLAHGHGLGALVVMRSALATADGARELAGRVALDIAAYDQRGCLSPHFALVERGGALDAGAFAELLAEALAAIETSLPRAALPAAAAAAQLQWRGVAAAIGELHTTQTAAVSYEARHPLRPSPGYRNLSVHECADLADVHTRLAALGPHLKALAIAAPRVPRALAALAPYLCEPGAMQTPPLHVALDGLHPLAGLTSFE